MATTLFGKQTEQRRLRAMTLLDQGRSQSQVARMLGVTHAAVSQWVKLHRCGGDEALRARHGYTTELWTLARVGEVIEKYFDVTYDPSGVWHVLNRMGWSCQKSQRRARERDEDAIVTWHKVDWPRIKKSETKR